MRLSVAAMLAIAMLAPGLAACGSEDKLSKAELATKANAICTDFDKRIAEVPQPRARNPELAAAYYAQTRPIVSEMADRLEKLEPEDSVKKDWETYVDKQNEAVRLLDDLVRQIKDRDDAAQRTLAQISSAIADGSAAVKRTGANACASTASSPG